MDNLEAFRTSIRIQGCTNAQALGEFAAGELLVWSTNFSAGGPLVVVVTQEFLRDILGFPFCSSTDLPPPSSDVHYVLRETGESLFLNESEFSPYDGVAPDVIVGR